MLIEVSSFLHLLLRYRGRAAELLRFPLQLGYQLQRARTCSQPYLSKVALKQLQVFGNDQLSSKLAIVRSYA